MRKKKLFYSILFLYLLAIGLFVWAATRNRHERTLPLLDEQVIVVPTPAAIKASSPEPLGDTEVAHMVAAARHQIILNKRFRLKSDIEGVGNSGDPITEQILAAMTEKGIAKTDAWDTRMLIAFSRQEVRAAEDLKAPDSGICIISAGQPIAGTPLFDYLKAHNLKVSSVRNHSSKPQKVLVHGMGSIIGFNATMVMVGINFLVLVALLYAMLWEPVVRILDERAEKIRTEIESAEEKLRSSEQLEEERKKELHSAYLEREELRDKGRLEGREERQDIIDAAQQEVLNMKARARSEIAAEEAAAREELVNELGNFSVSLATRILQKEVSPDTHAALIDDLVRELKTNPAGNK
ncbi:MAG: F0F1 ATP synthase subunit B [Planctomycetes bacterium]|nr:F0F1 ATP synthase subunit B [Planctomycetota bacterium]